MSTILTLRSLSQSFRYNARPINKSIALKQMAPHLSMSTIVEPPKRQAPQPPPLNSDEWRVIYRLPLIRLVSAFNRVKIPYGLLNAATVPGAFALEHFEQLPPTTAVLIATVGITSWLTLTICSLATKNLVGFIYVNDNNDKMKLAYVDFWGKRHDTSFDLDDLVPESEKKKPSKFDFYQSLTLYSNDKASYKLLQRYGLIEDPGTFSGIFGD